MRIELTHLDEILAQAITGSAFTADQLRVDNEELAEAEINVYLEARFDMATEFALVAPEATRYRMIMKCYIDIVIYNIHFTINPRDIPEIREKNYDKCIDMLMAFRDGNLKMGGAITEVVDPLVATRQHVIKSSEKFVSKPFDDDAIINPTPTT